MLSQKTVLAIFPDEINACISQFPWLAKEANWICLSIDALDRCLQLKLPHAQMPDWLQATGTFSAAEHQYIYSKLQDLEESFAEQRNSMGFSERAYWNHQHNLTMLTLLSSAKKTAALAVENLSKSTPLLVLQRMGVGDYHFPGGLLTAIIQDKLQCAGFNIETIYFPESQMVSTYAPTVYSLIPNYWSSEVSGNWRQSKTNVLISPAGLFYNSDKRKLLKLMQELGGQYNEWSLSPPFWNVIPDGAGFKGRISIQSAYENLAPLLRKELFFMVESMTASTDKLMQEILGDKIESLNFYRYQIQRIKQRHLFQCLTFFGVAHLSVVKTMDALVIGNLDGGINGPLFSAAKNFSSPCYMLPHSHVANQPSDDQCTIITEYWQPKPSITHRGDLNFPVYLPTEVPLDAKINICSTRRSQKVLIVFNGIHRWTKINIGLEFIKNILDNIKEISLRAGYELAYRLKPGDQTPMEAYCKLFEIDRADCEKNSNYPLDVVLKNTELVISIDDPSSALWEAMELGCGVILISGRSFEYSALIDDSVLESYSPSEGVLLLKKVLSDVKQLDKMRQGQFRKLHALRESRLQNYFL